MFWALVNCRNEMKRRVKNVVLSLDKRISLKCQEKLTHWNCCIWLRAFSSSRSSWVAVQEVPFDDCCCLSCYCRCSPDVTSPTESSWYLDSSGYLVERIVAVCLSATVVAVELHSVICGKWFQAKNVLNKLSMKIINVRLSISKTKFRRTEEEVKEIHQRCLN